MYVVGLYLEPHAPDEAQAWLARAAAGGYVDAIVKLGVQSQQRGDRKRARELYEQAAEAGSAPAMFNLGLLLEKTDRAKAHLWYEKAAAAGDLEAMFNLGRLIEAKDPDGARELWERAAAGGQPDAKARLQA
jgi:TPR repeat protein